MKVCAFVLVAPFSIPTVSLNAPASLCRDYLASAPGLVTAACLALRPPLLRHPSLPSQTRDPSVLRGGERGAPVLLVMPTDGLTHPEEDQEGPAWPLEPGG